MWSLIIVSQHFLLLCSTSTTLWCLKCRSLKSPFVDGSESPSKKWNPDGVQAHHWPSPIAKKGLILWRWFCQLSSLCRIKDFFTVVPWSSGNSLAIWDTCVSPFCTERRACRCSCSACRRSMIWGNTFSVWWLVHDFAISRIAFLGSLHWDTVVTKARTEWGYGQLSHANSDHTFLIWWSLLDFQTGLCRAPCVTSTCYIAEEVAVVIFDDQRNKKFDWFWSSFAKGEEFFCCIRDPSAANKVEWPLFSSPRQISSLLPSSKLWGECTWK